MTLSLSIVTKHHSEARDFFDEKEAEEKELGARALNYAHIEAHTHTHGHKDYFSLRKKSGPPHSLHCVERNKEDYVY